MTGEETVGVFVGIELEGEPLSLFGIAVAHSEIESRVQEGRPCIECGQGASGLQNLCLVCPYSR